MQAGLRGFAMMMALSALQGCIDPPKAPYVSVSDLVERIHETGPSAEQGTAEDQYRLGVKYESLLRDHQEAARWYRRAAMQQHPDAIYRLCALSDSGRGLPQDFQEALRWCRLAADHGHPRAMFSIGTFFEHGRGVSKDLVQAHQWYNLAAGNGFEEGAKKRDRLALDMTAPQIAQAQSQARNWKAKYQDSHE